jgi:hypothetical protein
MKRRGGHVPSSRNDQRTARGGRWRARSPGQHHRQRRQSRDGRLARLQNGRRLRQSRCSARQLELRGFCASAAPGGQTQPEIRLRFALAAVGNVSARAHLRGRLLPEIKRLRDEHRKRAHFVSFYVHAPARRKRNIVAHQRRAQQQPRVHSNRGEKRSAPGRLLRTPVEERQRRRRGVCRSDCDADDQGAPSLAGAADPILQASGPVYAILNAAAQIIKG